LLHVVLGVAHGELRLELDEISKGVHCAR
jgi:hypothetical protein